MARPKKSYAEVALEMYESVQQSDDKVRKLKSSVFWHEFRVKKRTMQVVERIGRILTEQKLTVSVKSGDVFGKERYDDRIILTIWPPQGEIIIPVSPIFPPIEWFSEMKTREFESEREVEYCFIMPLLEKLGYEYDDIAIGYPVTMFEGVHKTKKQVDVALFNGPSRKNEDALLVIEGKVDDKGITVDHIGQAKSYARELLPACYVITNGRQIIVFQFNGMMYQDERVMDFDRSMLYEMWEDLYKYISKRAAIDRKMWLTGLPKKASTLVVDQHQPT
ncbi:MAG: hypothetical protein BWY74_01412 [Firmicutes bacterium ADurb.Bin419]|jgi:hypothetical protein|uniref:Type I restriction enzyme R protein N-terminal domain-containing protein n=1 Tax=hydrocarbon metagenome TaxID=938273 RepID=A0A0W8FDU4_9ZZZZ|nr:type I restriction enzyme HsdR N-terminal domain-containing protein [Methanothrix soehngenii]OPZ92796.1 MAG: hypothetical protein BWY74_01412 [Firmicutes bacterium ADurb.Bin419]HOI19822.1 type I restriction enzyme HsdR N-terminal domain-containing protein [Methanothrix soehngenii]